MIWAVVSIGLAAWAYGAIRCSWSWRSADSVGTAAPTASRASAAITPKPPEVVTTATRTGRASGVATGVAKARTVSRNEEATTAPDCSRRSRTRWGLVVVRAPVWEAAAVRAATENPLWNTTTDTPRASARSSRAGRAAGLRRDSKASTRVSMSLSATTADASSSRPTSASLPTWVHELRPNPSRRMRSSREVPTAALWVTSAIRPALGNPRSITGENSA